MSKNTGKSTEVLKENKDTSKNDNKNVVVLNQNKNANNSTKNDKPKNDDKSKQNDKGVPVSSAITIISNQKANGKESTDTKKVNNDSQTNQNNQNQELIIKINNVDKKDKRKEGGVYLKCHLNNSQEGDITLCTAQPCIIF